MPRTSENNGKLLKYLKEKYAELDKPVLEERLEQEKKKTLSKVEKPLSERLCTAYTFIFIQMSSGENAASGC